MTTLECAIQDAQLEVAKDILEALLEDKQLLITEIEEYEEI